MILLGICGKKYSGKDTMADYLVANYGFEKRTFAGPLKDACRDLFLFSEDQLHNPRLKEVVDPRWNLSPRAALQMVGTDWMRNRFQKNFWVDRMRFDLVENPNARVVISDVRFENEKDLVLALGGQVCTVSRYSVRRELFPVEEHESETHMDHFVGSLPSILNNGSVLQFHQKIDEYIVQVL